MDPATAFGGYELRYLSVGAMNRSQSMPKLRPTRADRERRPGCALLMLIYLTHALTAKLQEVQYPFFEAKPRHVQVTKSFTDRIACAA